MRRSAALGAPHPAWQPPSSTSWPSGITAMYRPQRCRETVRVVTRHHSNIQATDMQGDSQSGHQTSQQYTGHRDAGRQSEWSSGITAMYRPQRCRETVRVVTRQGQLRAKCNTSSKDKGRAEIVDSSETVSLNVP